MMLQTVEVPEWYVLPYQRASSRHKYAGWIPKHELLCTPTPRSSGTPQLNLAHLDPYSRPAIERDNEPLGSVRLA